MCTRFSRVADEKTIAQRFLLEGPILEMRPDYNISPTDPVYVVVEDNGKRILKQMFFGLIPSWAKDPKIGLKCMNARAETVATLPSFRDSFRKRRCLVLSDGFFEWERIGTKKLPRRIVLKDRALFAMAGLWDIWRRPDGKEISSMAIVTTEPNELVRKIHNRMPVILKQENENLWLSSTITEPKTLLPLLTSYPSEEMDSYQVSTAMNSSREKSELCVVPVTREKSLF
jgi:putative SOS response-associated peptidase YedK